MLFLVGFLPISFQIVFFFIDATNSAQKWIKTHTHESHECALSNHIKQCLSARDVIWGGAVTALVYSLLLV